jgi:hypothetical protein
MLKNLLLAAALIPILVSCQAMAPEKHALQGADDPAGGSFPSAREAPAAAADNPMEPRSDMDEMGDCELSLNITIGARLFYGETEGLVASTDAGDPTPLYRADASPFSGRFLMEAEILNVLFGPFPRWSQAAPGYARVIVTPPAGEGAYIDLKLPPEPVAGANVVLTGLNAPAGALVTIEYHHRFEDDPSEAADSCALAIVPPPDFSETPAPYTPDRRARFESARAEGQVHTAAVLRIVRVRADYFKEPEKPILRDLLKRTD